MNWSFIYSDQYFTMENGSQFIRIHFLSLQVKNIYVDDEMKNFWHSFFCLNRLKRYHSQNKMLNVTMHCTFCMYIKFIYVMYMCGSMLFNCDTMCINMGSRLTSKYYFFFCLARHLRIVRKKKIILHYFGSINVRDINYFYYKINSITIIFQLDLLAKWIIIPISIFTKECMAGTTALFGTFFYFPHYRI